MERNKELTQELQRFIDLYETREKEDSIAAKVKNSPCLLCMTLFYLHQLEFA